MKYDKLLQLKMDLTGLTLAEKYEMNTYLVKAIRAEQAGVASIASMTFSVGDKVTFVGRRHEKLLGKITKMNPKNAIVLLNDKICVWRVAYNHLTKV